MSKHLIYGILFFCSLVLLGDISFADSTSAVIRIDGSSTVYPITEAVAEEFGMTDPRVKITVGISGTGGGFKKFCAGETEISDASRPIKKAELEICHQNDIDFIELPVAYDALTVVVNAKNTWAKSMTVAELKKLWEPEAQGKVMRWSHIRTGWPDAEIHLFGAGVDSGTYDYFTEAVVGKEHASRGDYTSSEDDNVLVQGVANDANALGFFGYAYYKENSSKLRAVEIDDGKDDNGKGPQLPSPESVVQGTYQPLSRPLFIYVSKKGSSRPEVRDFVAFYLKQAEKLVAEVGYVPTPGAVYALAGKRFESGVTGSIFAKGGSQVGVTLETLLEQDDTSRARFGGRTE